MPVVRNLMIRIGADYSAARKGMDGATRELTRFKRDTIRATDAIRGRNGLGGVAFELKNIGGTVASSLSRLRGARGIGGVVSELGSLRPALGFASRGMSGLGASAGSATAALGATTLAVGIFAAALAIATVGVYAASQRAVRFEADIGRLNMQLKNGSRGFMTWARSMGLAKESAAQMGATYGTILSSFIRDNSELASQTKQIVQTTRVVASETGRTIKDVTERIRSGLLGNTEAIEDLGVFVNVSMIESTDAFKKFANGKHWNQLDFQVQQQIRLAAILEQAYKRYGNELQNNVMTKQTLLMEQLKDIKLNLSQAFMPIWDAIVPTLTAWAKGLAYVTEQIARLSYLLRGWNYDERTQGVNDQTDALQAEGDAYDDLADQVKKAKKELASFDRLNLLGNNSGDNGSGNGLGKGGGLPSLGTPPDMGDPWKGIPPYPPLLAKKWKIEFDPPEPPDAGIGAVATAVTSTVNNMSAETKAKLAKMWGDLQEQTQAGAAGQLKDWNGFSSGVTSGIIPSLTFSANQQWAQMWKDMQGSTATNAPQLQAKFQGAFDALQPDMAKSTQNIKITWKTMLDGILGDTLIFTPLLGVEWSKVNNSILSTETPLISLKLWWHGALDYMQSQINAYRPYLEDGLNRIKSAINGLKPALETTKESWHNALSNMRETASDQLSTIESAINSVSSAWDRMRQKISSALPEPPPLLPIPSKSPAATPAPTASNESALSPLLSLDSWKKYFKTTLSAETFSKMWGTFESEAAKPENQAGMTALGLFTAGGTISKTASQLLKQLPQLFKGLGGAIPAFASGAAVYGPTYAMVGDNPGAAMDPEIVAPQSLIVEATQAGNQDVVRMLERVERAVKDIKYIQAVISASEVTRTAVDGANQMSRRTGRTPIRV